MIIIPTKQIMGLSSKVEKQIIVIKLLDLLLTLY